MWNCPDHNQDHRPQPKSEKLSLGLPHTEKPYHRQTTKDPDERRGKNDDGGIVNVAFLNLEVLGHPDRKGDDPKLHRKMGEKLTLTSMDSRPDACFRDVIEVHREQTEQHNEHHADHEGVGTGQRSRRDDEGNLDEPLAQHDEREECSPFDQMMFIDRRNRKTSGVRGRCRNDEQHDGHGVDDYVSRFPATSLTSIVVAARLPSHTY